ncbi:hypothetical protein OG302_21050 [Streptomyces sp. NBC_01283]|uniref:hypothetical protein n=1 Tax=Streptomyces sp. NBC_01283 TaxID=2903812 RepID=UPI00352ED3AC|nr:hypothetical protein OG302_21050 [Streptomyces sp. NBC_01283]
MSAVGAAALCAVMAFQAPGQAGAAAGGTSSPNPGPNASPYAFAEGATSVDGAQNSVDSVRLTPGATYKSSLARGGKVYYQLRLDASETVYVSATAVPGLDAKVAYGDGVEVSLQDANGNNCDSGDARFGTSQSPRPISAWAVRAVGPAENRCKAAGTYYVVVERNSDPGSSTETWDTELRVVSEPGVSKRGSTTPPDSWNSASPTPADGTREERRGGTGFNDARALKTGVWGDRIKPGQTLFYRVPVDWGQQISASAELGSASGGRDEYVTSALVMSLANPVRARIDDADTAYDGQQKTTALKPVAPVAYENRFSPMDRVAGTRFAGWYYLSVHLNPQVARQFGKGPLDLTLRVNVDGVAKEGPAYVGTARPADEFSVTGEDEDAAVRGETDAGSGGGSGNGKGDGDAMKVVAAGGFGGGALLLTVLGVWTLIGRRRAAAAASASTANGS